MAIPKKREVTVHTLSQPVEIKSNSERTGSEITGSGVIQEMPTVTTLLQRKKLSSGAKTTTIKSGPIAQPTMPSPTLSVPLEVSVATPQPEAESPIVTVAPVNVEAVVADAAPQVTPSRRRGVTRSISVAAELAAPALAQVTRGAGAPPQFRGVLVVDSLELKQFQKSLKAHKKVADMRKLDCLGYFSTRFSEVAYFQVDETGKLLGVFGFGNIELVANTRSKAITAEMMPSIYEMLAQGECFVGKAENLRAEDQKALRELGFGATQNVGAFPMIRKKAVTGLWLCAARSLEEIPAKEIKALKKILADLQF